MFLAGEMKSRPLKKLGRYRSRSAVAICWGDLFAKDAMKQALRLRSTGLWGYDDLELAESLQTA